MLVTPLFVGPVLCGAMPYGIGWSSAARVSKESGQGMSPVGTLSEHRSRARRSWGETMMELDSESRVAVGDPRWRLLYGGMCLALSTGLAGALLVAIAGASWTSGFLWFLYLLAATAVAAIIGLIFGLPRTLSGFQPSPTERYKGNSNLEEISDWLTKLLVGVGLVQLAAVPGQLVQLSDYLSKDMDLPNASSYVSAAIVYGASVGFIFAYLWSRLRLHYLFEFSDRQASWASRDRQEKLVADHLKAAEVSSQTADGAGVRIDPKAIRVVARQAVLRASVARDTAPILWVDDSPSNNTSIVAALRDLGFTVDQALSTADGLDRLARGTYSVAITDMGRVENGTMVSDAGEQFLMEARTRYPNLPVLVFSTGRTVQRATELKAKGATLVTSSGKELFAETVRLATL